MFLRHVIISLAFGCFCVFAKIAHFPKQLMRCHQNDTKFETCLKNAIQIGLPYLSKGIPEAGLLPLEPLFMNEVSMYQNLGPVKVNVTFMNFDIFGLSKAIIKRVKADVKKYRIGFSINVGHVYSTGSYRIRATVLGLPIDGSGTHRIDFDNMDIDFMLWGERESRSDADFFRVKDVTCTIDTKKLKFDLKNLFNGNKVLGYQANAFLNRFSDTVFKEVQEIGGYTVGQMIKEVSKGFFKKIPYTEIYL